MFSFLYPERGFDDCLLGSQIDGYYRFEPLGGNREELEKAATKIQSTFRGHKARQEAQVSRRTANHEEKGELPRSPAESFGGKEYDGKEDAAATCIQAGYRGYSSRKARNEAATTIQAGYRGYAVRKGLGDSIVIKPVSPVLETDSNDIERNEDEVAAAIKIQSAFRGHRARDAIRDDTKSNVPEIKDNEGDSTRAKDDSAANKKSQQSAGDYTKETTEKDVAATKIQSNYRGYYTRKQLGGKNEAATTIQAHYRGYRVRELRRTRSEAAVKIQSHYRGYKTRAGLKKRHSTKSFLEVSKDDEFALHRDSRTSFSLPQGIKFEGNLDEDSDAEIDKMVDKLKAIKESSSPDMADVAAEDKQDGAVEKADSGSILDQGDHAKS